MADVATGLTGLVVQPSVADSDGAFWMYHPTNGDTPDGGRLFDPSVPGTPSREALAAQGWADHPHKVGIPRGQSAAEREHAQMTKRRVDDGLLPAIDEQLNPEQVLRQAEELEQLRRERAEREAEIEDLKTKREGAEDLIATAREAKEQEADEASDAARESERHLGTATPDNTEGEEKVADARSDAKKRPGRPKKAETTTL